MSKFAAYMKVNTDEISNRKCHLLNHKIISRRSWWNYLPIWCEFSLFTLMTRWKWSCAIIQYEWIWASIIREKLIYEWKPIILLMNVMSISKVQISKACLIFHSMRWLIILSNFMRCGLLSNIENTYMRHSLLLNIFRTWRLIKFRSRLLRLSWGLLYLCAVVITFYDMDFLLFDNWFGVVRSSSRREDGGQYEQMCGNVKFNSRIVPCT